MLKCEWLNTVSLESKSYVCGHCGSRIASEKGYLAQGMIDGKKETIGTIYICHNCYSPAFFYDRLGLQVPGPAFGEHVKDIPFKEVEVLYEEARSCLSVNAYTAAVLCCRKLLMNIAVSKKAPEGLTFFEYVEFLAHEEYVPPDGKEWVDHIRSKGNEPTHSILIVDRVDAEELITFIEMLLKFIYEFPAAIQKTRVERR